MELKIDIDETMFKDVVEKELNAFSKEELHEIIRKCIEEYLRSDNLKSFFVEHRINNSYYGAEKVTVAGELLKDAAKSFDLSDCFKEIQQNMIDEIKNNHKEILEKVMLNMILDGISNNYNFAERMSNQIQYIINRNNNC